MSTDDKLTSNDSPGEITARLEAWGRDEPGALDALMPLVLRQLRRIAQYYLQNERAGHTLQATGLVNELYLRLMGRREVNWEGREQFFASASKLMRRILIESARAHKALKRGGGIEIVSLTGSLERAKPVSVDPETLISLDAALGSLEERDPRAAKIVNLRFFAGMTSAEAAKVLGISRATVTREWTVAKAYLARAMEDTTGRLPSAE